MLHVTFERGFKKGYKIAGKRGKNLKKIDEVIKLLAEEKALPEKYYNHKLTGTYLGCWECHIEPDWLLIYKRNSTELFLIDTGTHSDLFK